MAGLVVLAVAQHLVPRLDREDDGVLWESNGNDVIASVVAEGSPAARAGIRPGDRSLGSRSAGLVAEGRRRGLSTAPARPTSCATSSFATATPARRTCSTSPSRACRRGRTGSIFALAGVGLFTLLVGTGVRLRRPENQATLHFFWLSIAFFGVLTFSFSGRLDRLDWVFYWADVVAMLLLPPLFVHFALVFPERPDSWARSDTGRTLLPLLYLPALLLGGAQGRDDHARRSQWRRADERAAVRRPRRVPLPRRCASSAVSSS